MTRRKAASKTSKPEKEAVDNNGHFGRALYYPYIYIQDINWLKAALLYWDGLHRIVPEYDFKLKDDEEAQQVVDCEKLTPIKPERYRDAAGKRFRETVLPLAQDSRAKRYLSRAFGGGLQSRSLAQIHQTKLPEDLRQELIREGLAQPSDYWLYMDGAFANSYMLCLAAEMSTATRAPLAADDVDLGCCGEYFSFGKPREKGKDPDQRSLLLSLGIEFPHPEALHGIPMSRILAFNEQRADERRAFRSVLEGISEQAVELEDPQALEDYLSQERKKIGSALKNHRKALNELRVKFADAACRISVPLGFAAVATAVAPFSAALSAALGIAGIGLGVAAWWADRRSKVRQELGSCPWHYLLSLESDFPFLQPVMS